MVTYRARLGRLGANNDVSTVTAFPNDNTALLKDGLGFHVVQKCTVALLVRLFNSGNTSELCGKIVEAFFVSFLSKGVVHIGPLIVLALSGVKKVFGGIAKLTESLEPELCMLLLVLGGLKEQLCDLLIACLLCYGSKVCILVSCLGLASKRLCLKC